MAYFSVCEYLIIGGVRVWITYSTSSVLLVTSRHSLVMYNMLGDWLCAVTESFEQGEVCEFSCSVESTCMAVCLAIETS